MKKMMTVFIAFIGITLTGLFLAFLQESGQAPKKAELKAFERLPYFKNGQFVPPHPVHPPFTGDYEDKVSIPKLLMSKSHGPQKPVPIHRLTASSFPEKPEKSAVYWLGHSSGILELSGKRIGVDIVLDNAAPFPFIVKRYQPAPIARYDLPKMDFIREKRELENLTLSICTTSFPLKLRLTSSKVMLPIIFFSREEKEKERSSPLSSSATALFTSSSVGEYAPRKNTEQIETAMNTREVINAINTILSGEWYFIFLPVPI